MVVKTIEKYANTVTDQNNPNIKHRVKWDKPENAIGHHNDTSAVSSFIKKKIETHYKTEYVKDKNGKEVAVKKADKWDYEYHHPNTLSAHDFRFEVPSNAVITEIKYEVRMRASNTSIPVPRARFCVYGGAYKDKTGDTKSFKTGWNNGIYYHVIDGDLGTAYDTYTYVMNRKNIETSKIKNRDINMDVFGIDLEFFDAFTKDKADNKTGKVGIHWVKCTIKYELPDAKYQIYSPVDYWDEAVSGNQPNLPSTIKGTKNNPHIAYTNEKFPLKAILKNGSLAKNSNKSVIFEFPKHTQVVGTPICDGQWSNNTWTVSLPAQTVRNLNFWIKSKRIGLSYITCTIGDKKYYYYYYVNAYNSEGFSDIVLSEVGDLHIRHRGCINILLEGNSLDNLVSLSLSEKTNMSYVDWSLDDNCVNVQEIVSKNDGGCTVLLNTEGDYTLSINYCFYPLDSTVGLTVTNLDEPSHHVSSSFDVDDPYQYSIGIIPYYAKISSHRVVSDIETNSSVIPIVADEVDANMVMGECSIVMDKWNELDYIGCIPLEQTHFQPKSTYKDTLLDTRYKNKRYMGKKLATDEDITLNVRLHPQQVTTLQGLIDMDKPIPINANHKCFEGDSLNHRGWCEIYAVKTEQTGNNPHWYKCDIDVKYLTHNLNTRFNIEKGKKVDDVVIPSLMTETFASGGNLSDDDNDPYFIVDTDGTFYYNAESVGYIEEFLDDNDRPITYEEGVRYTFTLNGVLFEIETIDEVVAILEERGYDVVTPVLNETLKYQVMVDIPENERNNFNIDNGQHINITTKNPLTHTSTVDFTWSSALIDETRENAITRIIKLIRKEDNETVFEYQYDQLKIVDDEVTANVIYRVKNGDDIDSSEEDITFRYNPSDYTQEAEEVVEDEETDINFGEAHFGTTTSFMLNNGKLSVRDAGFNGREVVIDDIQLEDGSYYYQVLWFNNNADEETSEIDCIFDFRVQDTILTSTYADKWSKLIISPFPVADKPILFTRKAEEGTIYYYTDDGKEFSYLIEPYYQYLNGTDLTYNGYSIFNLNYGYEVVYIQNGLVRLGFNRLTGDLYLGKYDPSSESYITVSRLHLSKFDDVNLNSISDDKIEVQASDSVFTIWRGHPYVQIKHELEDIVIDTQYNSVWAEQVGKDEAVELPAYWDLMNTKNLLPSSVGGNTSIKTKGISVEARNVTDRADTSLVLSSASTTDIADDPVSYNIVNGDEVKVLTGHDITFTLTDTALSSYTDSVDLDDSLCSFGELSWSETCDDVPASIPVLTPSVNPISSGDSVGLMAEVVNYCNQPVEGVRVDYYADVTGTATSLTIDVPLVLIYSDEFNITGVLTDENSDPVADADIDLYVGNTKVDTQTTDSDGTVEFTQTPVTTGNHTFKLKFNGKDSYFGSESSTVSRTVDKETSVLNITSPLDSSQWYTDTGITVEGSLTTDDGEPIANEQVKVRYGLTILASITTDSNGEFSTVLEQSNSGVYGLSFQFETTSLYTESVVTKQNINVSDPSLTLTGDKSILSYADRDSCNLLITLDSATPTGQLVELYSGAVKLGEADDNGDGTYSYEYKSQGVGDIVVNAKCGSLVSETYELCDATLYRANPTACTSCNIDLPSSALISYKMSKPRIDGSSGGISIHLIDSSHTYFVGNWASDGHNGLLIRNTGSSSNLVSQTCSDITANTEYTLGVTYDNGDWTYFKDNEVKSFSANYTPTKLNIIQIQQGTIKDLIIKPL